MDHVKNIENLMNNTKNLYRNIGDTMRAYEDLGRTVYKDGALNVKTKELITLGIAIAVRCEGCIEAHTKKCIAAGVTKEEFVEAISTAISMGGGPSMVYGGKALEAFEQFSENK